MTEETDAPQGGTEDVDTSSAVETPSEATTEQDTATESAESPDAGADDGEPQKRTPWFQKRIDELTAKRYEAERRAAYLEGLLSSGAAPQPAQQEGPPKEDQFASYEEYEEARIAHVVEQRLKAIQAQEQRSSVLRTYEERVAKVRETMPDYDSVVGDPSLTITPVMAEVIRESDAGPEVAYFLGTNRSEAQRIAALPQHRQAVELGKLEARLSAQPEPAPKVQKPIPPAPPQTITGLSAGINKSPEDMSMAEYVAWRASQQ